MARFKYSREASCAWVRSLKKEEKKGLETKHSSTKLNQLSHEGNKTSNAASFTIQVSVITDESESFWLC